MVSLFMVERALVKDSNQTVGHHYFDLAQCSIPRGRDWLLLRFRYLNKTHDMPYIPKRKQPPRNEILACTNHLLNIFLICLDTWINTGAKQSQKQYCKLKTRNNKQKWHNKTWLSKECCNMHMMSTHCRDNLQRSSFDLDSQPLMFDDGASASIANDLQDFMTKPASMM